MSDISSLVTHEADGGVLLPVRVVPGASVDAIRGIHGDALRVAVRAAPERGRANQAVLALLARALGVKKSTVRIVSGHTSRNKRVRVDGLSAPAARAILARVIRDG